MLSDGTVWLSPPGSADIDAIDEYCRESNIADWTTIPVPYTRTDAVNFVEEIVPTGWAARSPTWGIRLAVNAVLVGMVGLIEQDESAAEIGFWLAPSARSQGLMTTAVKLVCDFGFRREGLALRRIEWRAYVGNHGSAAVARRVGFRFEGTQREGLLQRGRRRDSWIAGLLAGDPRGSVEDWPLGV